MVPLQQGNLSTAQAQTYALIGPIVRIAPEEVSIADPQTAKIIYKVIVLVRTLERRAN